MPGMIPGAAGRPAALILLGRDSRAVVNSRLRKCPDRDPEQQIRDLAGKSLILISHRLANLRLAERGDHDSLMAKDGLYAQLFRTQAEAYR
jgi:hypothetical protein